jgi:DNA-binding transcriptional regulator GbsR (MarR family)
MLNWRRDPGYELRTRLIEQRTRETEIAILRERQKRLQIEQQIEQMKKEDEQIENEIEQLRRENARLAKLNAWDDALSALIKQHCFPPDSSSSPPKSTETDCGPSSP